MKTFNSVFGLALQVSGRRFITSLIRTSHKDIVKIKEKVSEVARLRMEQQRNTGYHRNLLEKIKLTMKNDKKNSMVYYLNVKHTDRNINKLPWERAFINGLSDDLEKSGFTLTSTDQHDTAEDVKIRIDFNHPSIYLKSQNQEKYFSPLPKISYLSLLKKMIGELYSLDHTHVPYHLLWCEFEREYPHLFSALDHSTVRENQASLYDVFANDVWVDDKTISSNVKQFVEKNPILWQTRKLTMLPTLTGTILGNDEQLSLQSGLKITEYYNLAFAYANQNNHQHIFGFRNRDKPRNDLIVLLGILAKEANEYNLADNNKFVLTNDISRQVVTTLSLSDNTEAHSIIANISENILSVTQTKDLTYYQFSHRIIQEYCYACLIAKNIIGKYTNRAAYDEAMTYLKKERFNTQANRIFWFIAGHLKGNIQALEEYFEALTCWPMDDSFTYTSELLLGSLDESGATNHFLQQRKYRSFLKNSAARFNAAYPNAKQILTESFKTNPELYLHTLWLSERAIYQPKFTTRDGNIFNLPPLFQIDSAWLNEHKENELLASVGVLYPNIISNILITRLQRTTNFDFINDARYILEKILEKNFVPDIADKVVDLYHRTNDPRLRSALLSVFMVIGKQIPELVLFTLQKMIFQSNESDSIRALGSYSSIANEIGLNAVPTIKAAMRAHNNIDVTVSGIKDLQKMVKHYPKDVQLFLEELLNENLDVLKTDSWNFDAEKIVEAVYKTRVLLTEHDLTKKFTVLENGLIFNSFDDPDLANSVRKDLQYYGITYPKEVVTLLNNVLANCRLSTTYHIVINLLGDICSRHPKLLKILKPENSSRIFRSYFPRIYSSLGKVNPDLAVKQLLSTIRFSSDKWVIAACISVLGSVGTKHATEIMPLMNEIYNHHDKYVQEKIVSLAARFNKNKLEGAEEILRSALNNPSLYIRVEAYAALQKDYYQENAQSQMNIKLISLLEDIFKDIFKMLDKDLLYGAPGDDTMRKFMVNEGVKGFHQLIASNHKQIMNFLQTLVKDLNRPEGDRVIAMTFAGEMTDYFPDEIFELIKLTLTTPGQNIRINNLRSYAKDASAKRAVEILFDKYSVLAAFKLWLSLDNPPEFFTERLRDVCQQERVVIYETKDVVFSHAGTKCHIKPSENKVSFFYRLNQLKQVDKIERKQQKLGLQDFPWK